MIKIICLRAAYPTSITHDGMTYSYNNGEIITVMLDAAHDCYNKYYTNLKPNVWRWINKSQFASFKELSEDEYNIKDILE
jgi:hypothetical protein